MNFSTAIVALKCAIDLTAGLSTLGRPALALMFFGCTIVDAASLWLVLGAAK